MKLTFVDRHGCVQKLEVQPGQTLMRVLRDLPDGVSGICGGVMACGTCHVYIDPADMNALPKPSAIEVAVLEKSVSARPNSRLSCQIFLRPTLTALRLSIAPEE